jgi:hypothetical protein
MPTTLKRGLEFVVALAAALAVLVALLGWLGADVTGMGDRFAADSAADARLHAWQDSTIRTIQTDLRSLVRLECVRAEPRDKQLAELRCLP